jgi:hypothetical protein
MRALLHVLVTGFLTVLPGLAGPSTEPVGPPDALQLVDLAAGRWSLDAAEPEDTERHTDGGLDYVRLPMAASGARWTTSFHTERAATFRLQLDWLPGPEGLLIEVMLDGERQLPLLDGWRPTRRHITTDLGPRWLGAGDHLLEFVARENPAQAGELLLHALQLHDPQL